MGNIIIKIVLHNNNISIDSLGLVIKVILFKLVLNLFYANRLFCLS